MGRLGPNAKIAIGWVVIISTGLAGFVFARDTVILNRKALMEARQRVRDQAQREGEEKFARLERERLEEQQKSNMTA